MKQSCKNHKFSPIGFENDSLMTCIVECSNCHIRQQESARQHAYFKYEYIKEHTCDICDIMHLQIGTTLIDCVRALATKVNQLQTTIEELSGK
jgi:hypothetical protein